MAETRAIYLVAVINSNEDILDSIRLILDDAGIPSISGHVIDFKKGRQSLVAFMEEYKPKVIIYDIAPPYEENWRFFQLVKDAKEVEGCQFVLTTTNKAALEKFVGETDAIEIIGKPFDLNEIVIAVKKQLQR